MVHALTLFKAKNYAFPEPTGSLNVRINCCRVDDSAPACNKSPVTAHTCTMQRFWFQAQNNVQVKKVENGLQTHGKHKIDFGEVS